jgi:hypothetical protein
MSTQPPARPLPLYERVLDFMACEEKLQAAEANALALSEKLELHKELHRFALEFLGLSPTEFSIEEDVECGDYIMDDEGNRGPNFIAMGKCLSLCIPCGVLILHFTFHKGGQNERYRNYYRLHDACPKCDIGRSVQFPCSFDHDAMRLIGHYIQDRDHVMNNHQCPPPPAPKPSKPTLWQRLQRWQADRNFKREQRRKRASHDLIKCLRAVMKEQD